MSRQSCAEGYPVAKMVSRDGKLSKWTDFSFQFTLEDPFKAVDEVWKNFKFLQIKQNVGLFFQVSIGHHLVS